MPHHHHRRSLHPVSDRLIESFVPSITFLAIVTHFSAHALLCAQLRAQSRHPPGLIYPINTGLVLPSAAAGVVFGGPRREVDDRDKGASLVIAATARRSTSSLADFSGGTAGA